MHKIESKLPDVGTTIFAVMSKMAAEHHAINLSQGFPDFPVSEKLISLVSEAMQQGHNQYAPMPGLPSLRESIAQMIGINHAVILNAETEITITAGATEALFATLMALVKKGDEVIVFDPAYDSYGPAIRLSGGTPVHLKLNNRFGINWDEVAAAITERTRIIMINSPHNPSGAILTTEDIAQLEQLVLKHDLLVLSDEVYEWIIFDGEQHQTVLKSDILRERSIAVFSFGKTFHATGWKVGYTVAPEQISKEIRKVHQFLTFSVNTPMQWALANYLNNPENYNYLPSFYQKKRDYFSDKIKNSRFEILPCKGTYFQLLSYKEISNKPDTEMAEWLTKEKGVASIPVSVFYADKTDRQVLRFCFAKSEETLDKAAELLCKI
jgi:methionine transaminase